MIHLLLAATIGLFGMAAEYCEQELAHLKTSTVAIAAVSRAGVPLREAEKQAAPGVTRPKVRQEIPPTTSQLPETATLPPQIGLLSFFMLSVFAVLLLARKSPRW